jgi:hypothetical protein
MPVVLSQPSQPSQPAALPFSEFLAALFDALSAAGVRPCVLRNYQGFPSANLGNDIDLLIAPADLPRAAQAIRSIAGLRIAGYTERRLVANFFLEGIEQNAGSRALQIDFDLGLYWKGLRYMPVEAVLEAAIPRQAGNASFYIPSPAHEAIISLMASLLLGGYVKEKYFSQVQKTFAEESSAVIVALAPCFGTALSAQLVEAAIAANRPKLLRCVRPLRRALLLRNILRAPLRGAWAMADYYARELAFRTSPRTLETVFILAPNGFRSAAIAGSLIPRLQSLAVAVEQHPLRSRLVLRHNPSAKDTAARPEVKALQDSFLSFAGLASWLAGEWLNQFADKKNLTLRICQGCCPSSVGPGSGWLFGQALRLLPSPLLCILLGPRAEGPAASRRELFYGKTNEVCRALVENGRSYILLNASLPDDRITAEAHAAIVDALARRAELKLNKRFPPSHARDKRKAAH